MTNFLWGPVEKKTSGQMTEHGLGLTKLPTNQYQLLLQALALSCKFARMCAVLSFAT